MKKDLQPQLQKIIEISLEDTYELNAYFEYQNSMEIEDLQQNILKKIKCNHCGWCCSNCNVLLTDEDIVVLCKHFNMNFNEFYDKYMDKETIMNYLSFPCPFLDDTNQCKIYEIRPRACRNFPFNAFLLNINPCDIGKKIIKIIDDEIAQKMLSKMSKKDLKALEEKLKRDKMFADNKIELYNKLDILLPKFNEECGQTVAIIDKDMLKKIEKELYLKEK